MAVDHNNPQSRDEEILIATIDGTEYNKLPQSRMEELLLELKEVIEESGGGGTSDYTRLQNLPKINNVTLTGDMTAEDLSLVLAEVGKGLSTNDYSDAEKAKVANLVTSIQSILDGTDIDSFGDVEIALLDKADISDLGTAAAKNSTNAVTAGSTDLVESGAVKDAIDSAVSRTYHHAGTKTVAQLTHDLLIAANEGNVYEITDNGTTTSDFMEGIGKPIKEGDNVGIARVTEGVYMFDLLSGFVDTSNFVQKSETAGLLNNDGTVNTTIEGDVDDLQEWTSADTKTVTGNPITISDAAAVKAKALSMTVEPIQDLHGYDKPWVGGAGKNKLPMTVDEIKTRNTNGTWSGNTYTINGIVFDVLTNDGDNVIGIKAVSGTAIADASITSGRVEFDNNTEVTLNGCPSGGSSSTYSILVWESNSVVMSDYGNGNTASIMAGTITAFIKSGYTIPTGGLTFYPMIRLSTETDATFEPYTNICPITGHTEVDVQRDGNDVWAGNDSYTIATAGHIIPNTTITLPAGKYALDFEASNPSGVFEFEVFKGNSVDWANRLFDKVFTAKARNIVEFTLTEASTNLRLYSSGGASISNVRLFSTVDTYTIALGDTIYGGEVDFETGKVRVTHKYVDLGDLTFVESTIYKQTYISDVKAPASNHDAVNAVCEQYNIVARMNTDNNGDAAVNTDKYLLIRTSDTPDGGFCYELATPTELTLTPAQLELLKGHNTITANGATITLTYQPDNLVGEVMEQVDDKVDGAKTYTDTKVAALLPTYPTTDGAYVLTATVASGETVLSWESAT